jgi:hypothetical protein
VIVSLSLVVEGLDKEPVGGDRIIGGAQRHRGKPVIDGGGVLTAFVDGLAMLAQFGAMEIFGMV